MINLLPPAPSNPAAAPPPRRPGSVRRTATMLMHWPDGFGTPLHLVGRARDLLTPSDRHAEPVVVAEATMAARVSNDRTIEAIESSPARPAITQLVGARGGGGFRKMVDQVLPGERQAGTPLYLLLDDIAGSTLIAGFAWSRSGMDWNQRARQSGADMEQIEKTRQGMENICSGFRTGSSALTLEARSGHNVAHVPPLGDVTDPWSWHQLDPHPAVAMRRSRRIDVWRDEHEILIDAMFRDSCWAPDGSEVAVHEYRLEATVDPVTMTVASVMAEPRVLPYPECPGAAPNVVKLVGVPVADLRHEVLTHLRSVECCTHLNDALRALAEVPILLAPLTY
jgi:hypothetical protein